MKPRVGRRAAQHVQRIDAWWAEHRPDAPALFLDEFGSVLKMLSSTPEVGVPCPTERRPGLRRVHLPRSRYHVYYEVDEAGAMVKVLAVWSAVRGRRPAL